MSNSRTIATRRPTRETAGSGRLAGPAGAGSAEFATTSRAHGLNALAPIALDDLVDADVAPAASLMVDDAQDGGLALEIAERPTPPSRVVRCRLACRWGRSRFARTLPSINRSRHVVPGNRPPPIKKLR